MGEMISIICFILFLGEGGFSFKLALNFKKKLFHILKYDAFFRSKIELQNIEERSFHIGGSAQDGGGGGGGGDILPQDPNCAC